MSSVSTTTSTSTRTFRSSRRRSLSADSIRKALQTAAIGVAPARVSSTGGDGGGSGGDDTSLLAAPPLVRSQSERRRVATPPQTPPRAPMRAAVPATHRQTMSLGGGLFDRFSLQRRARVGEMQRQIFSDTGVVSRSRRAVAPQTRSASPSSPLVHARQVSVDPGSRMLLRQYRAQLAAMQAQMELLQEHQRATSRQHAAAPRRASSTERLRLVASAERLRQRSPSAERLRHRDRDASAERLADYVTESSSSIIRLGGAFSQRNSLVRRLCVCVCVCVCVRRCVCCSFLDVTHIFSIPTCGFFLLSLPPHLTSPHHRAPQ